MSPNNCAVPGFYQNPVLPMDYSDPDVIRVGIDYYLVASSFTYLPGVPLLHSRDMVHWEQLSWCVERLPFERYRLPAHGSGTWAPAIRFHDGMFYVFIPLPDEGIFVTTAAAPCGPWSELRCLKETVGWIDPCPFWDDDGSAYMAHAFANSRCGIKHRLDICRMAPDASSLLDDGTVVYQNELLHPTLEGPKMYKRNGWYYLFAPAGGVGTGWQVALRSRNPLGPYEIKIVMNQGTSAVNGPHQGAWVDTPDGRDWFFHFQQYRVYGRVLHLQPMCWVDDWPFIGQERNGDGIGEPVDQWPLPLPEFPASLRADDDFAGPELGIQWQWQANPQSGWYTVRNGLTLYMPPCERGESLLWYMPNVLTQMPQGWVFSMRVTVALDAEKQGDEGGIAVMGHSYSALALRRGNRGNELCLYKGQVTEVGMPGAAEEREDFCLPMEGSAVTLCLYFGRGGSVRYGFVNEQGRTQMLPGRYAAAESTWSSAKPALFARNIHNMPTAGAARFDYAAFVPDEEAPDEI